MQLMDRNEGSHSVSVRARVPLATLLCAHAAGHAIVHARALCRARIASRATSDKEWVSSTSVDYLMYSGYVTLAAHWLRMEASASAALAAGSDLEEADFYRAKVQTSAFVFDRLLPRTRAHKAAMLSPVESLTAMHPDNFSFDHAR